MKKEHDFWDSYGRERSPWRYRTLYLHHRLEEREIVRILKGIPRSSSVLDVGCGDGYFLHLLSRKGFRRFRGVVAGLSMVERCRERGFPVERMSLEEMDTGEWFDLILLLQVLEYLEDPSAALGKIHELLRPGGRLLLTVPVCDSLLKRFGGSRMTQVTDWDDTHRHAFSVRTIRALLSSLGFRIGVYRHVSNPFPWIGRYGGERLGALFQRFDLRAGFGDILIVLAEKDVALPDGPTEWLTTV